jgi:DNA-binding response OmpR family regulator
MSRPNFHLLVVDDDPNVSDALEVFFDDNGFDTTMVASGEDALERLTTNTDAYDAVLLDVSLPGKSGFEVLEASQQIDGFTAPVIMLTGRGEQESKLTSFGLGADDYVVKPFNPDELLARVRAILTRTQRPDRTPMDVYDIGDVSINFSTHEATKEGEPIAFTALEYDILRYLILNRGQTVTRRQLLTDVWGIDQDIVTRTIDRHMASVRKKIEPDPAVPVFIETVYGIGYRFKG